jgi:outer membrane murein-binding lipoprotein Lpp
MKNKKFLLFPVLLASVSLAGCASTVKPQVNLNLRYVTANSVPATGDRAAQAQIAQAAGSVDKSLAQLSAIQVATHPGTKMNSPTTAAGMGRRVSLNWNGPVEPLLQQVAAKAGYRLSVIGARPAIPALVNVSARNQSLASIIRNTSYQVNAKARVAVYANQHLIELRYIGN